MKTSDEQTGREARREGRGSTALSEEGKAGKRKLFYLDIIRTETQADKYK